MKVGDLVNNTHAALDGQGLGLIVNVTKRLTESGLDIKVQWINPPPGVPRRSWQSSSWLELVSESR